MSNIIMANKQSAKRKILQTRSANFLQDILLKIIFPSTYCMYISENKCLAVAGEFADDELNCSPFFIDGWTRILHIRQKDGTFGPLHDLYT